jgi:hypothetical protein
LIRTILYEIFEVRLATAAVNIRENLRTYETLLTNPRGKYQTEELSVSERIMLKLILQKQIVKI